MRKPATKCDLLDEVILDFQNLVNEAPHRKLSWIAGKTAAEMASARGLGSSEPWGSAAMCGARESSAVPNAYMSFRK